MKVSVLGSGSAGNAVLVVAGETRLLIDAGFSARDLARRLARVGCEPHAIDGILITHDHGDHTRGMGVYARRHGTPLYVTDGTRRACGKLLRGAEEIRPYRAGHPFEIGAVRVEPFVTVHDAADPVGVAVVDRDTGCRLGVATDLGRPTAGIRHALSGAHMLVLEANHDAGLLHCAPYPPSVKARIASSHGHLSNEAAARFALDLMHDGLVGIVLAHLSRESNDGRIAAEVVGRALRGVGWRGLLEVARQDEPTPLYDVVALRERRGPTQLALF
ncbi:MAG: MBL fold metallo-hydrolase [Gemmatimonadetes bacterium]|nr:MBL fold metallo-hydrolase [Gemmatimonadota bacterium]